VEEHARCTAESAGISGPWPTGIAVKNKNSKTEKFSKFPKQKKEKRKMATLNFNANEVPPAEALEAVPAGKYIAVITESEVKPTKSGTGHFLELAFEIIEGELKGRKVWARLNLDNPNAQAVQIARGELSAICHAVGVMQPKDSAELHNLPMEISVRCKKREDMDELSNEIKGYAKKESSAAPATPAPQAKKDTPPWKRH